MDKYVAEAIEIELENQRQKYGIDKQQSFPGFLMIIQAELDEAKHGWLKSHKITEDRHTALAEVVQVAATAIACLERYGVVGCPGSLNDTLPPKPAEVCGECGGTGGPVARKENGAFHGYYFCHSCTGKAKPEGETI